MKERMSEWTGRDENMLVMCWWSSVEFMVQCVVYRNNLEALMDIGQEPGNEDNKVLFWDLSPKINA